MSGYLPPASLWELVTLHVPPSEWQEVKLMLGESLVEQSLELHQEVNTLLEIWQEYRAETEQASLPAQRLPEPPGARDNLKQEILFFVQSLQDKAQEKGRDPELVLSRHNSEVIDYVMADSGYSSASSSVPSTGRSSRADSAASKRLLRSPDSARGSVVSLEGIVVRPSEQLSVYRVEEVVAHLKQTLQEEVNSLTEDINFLQECLDEEADIRSESRLDTSREPTLTELRVERTRLEKALLTPDVKVASAIESSTKAPPRRLPSDLGPKSLSNLRPSSTSSTSSSVRLGPLKATHTLPKPPAESKPGSGGRRPRASQPSKRADGGAYVSDLERLSQNVSHMTVRTTKGAAAARPGAPETEHVPSPPADKPKRPRSAQRFRQMVLECRD